jgi:hypothetical protein
MIFSRVDRNVVILDRDGTPRRSSVGWNILLPSHDQRRMLLQGNCDLRLQFPGQYGVGWTLTGTSTCAIANCVNGDIEQRSNR